MPRGGAGVQPRSRRTMPAKGVQFVGIDDRDQTGRRHQLRARAPRDRTRASSTATGSLRAAVPAAPARRRRRPRSWSTARATSRPRSAASSTTPTCVPLVNAVLDERRRERHRRRQRAPTTFQHAAGRQPGARHPGRAARRPGLVPVAVRAAAGPGVPVLRHRAVRRRPRRRAADRGSATGRAPRSRSRRCRGAGPARRARPGAARLVAVRAGVLRRSSSCSARSSARSGAHLDEHAVLVDRIAGVVAIVDGRWRSSGWLPGFAARVAVPPAAGDRHRRRAAARPRLRRRLDALHRPDARRGARPGQRPQHRDGRPRRAAHRRRTASGSACRSSSPASRSAGRSARSRS